jgi:uncharacterized protein (DUF2267 family)
MRSLWFPGKPSPLDWQSRLLIKVLERRYGSGTAATMNEAILAPSATLSFLLSPALTERDNVNRIAKGDNDLAVNPKEESMEYQEFVKSVQEKAHCQDKQQAVQAIRATLQTLSERLLPDEADRLAAQLPRELQPIIKEPVNRGQFKLDEFIQRVARRERCEPRQAELDARAVIEVVRQVLTSTEVEELVSELPKEFWPLFGRRLENVR